MVGVDYVNVITLVFAVILLCCTGVCIECISQPPQWLETNHYHIMALLNQLHRGHRNTCSHAHIPLMCDHKDFGSGKHKG